MTKDEAVRVLERNRYAIDQSSGPWPAWVLELLEAGEALRDELAQKRLIACRAGITHVALCGVNGREVSRQVTGGCPECDALDKENA